MTLQKGVVSGLSGISSGVGFRLSQSNWYRKPLKQLQKMNETASSPTAPINDNLPSGKHSHKARESADACSLGRISCFTPNFPLCTGNMEAFRFQIQVECKELLQTSLAFTGRCTSMMRSASAGHIASDSRAGVNALAPGGPGLWFEDIDESAWRGLPLTQAQGNDVHAGSNIAFSLED